MLERALVRLMILCAFIVLVIAAVSVGGCGTIYGFGTDLRGMSAGMNKANQDILKDCQ